QADRVRQDDPGAGNRESDHHALRCIRPAAQRSRPINRSGRGTPARAGPSATTGDSGRGILFAGARASRRGEGREVGGGAESQYEKRGTEEERTQPLVQESANLAD